MTRTARSTARVAAAAVALLLLAACGDDDAATTPAGDAGGGGPASWSAIYADVIRPSCSCHLAGGGEGGLEMRDAAAAYTALVGTPSMTIMCSGRTRVVPGDPASSLLYQKVSGEDLCGPRMPLGRAELPSESIARIRAWIEAGARND